MESGRKGSILIGVLLMTMMIAAISIAILARTSSDSKLNIIAKDSHTAYQKSDENAEEIIRNLKDLDDDSDNAYRLPEGTTGSSVNCSFSGGSSTNCFKSGGEDDPLRSSDKLIDSDGNPVFYFVKQSGTSRDASRAVMIPMPNRVGNYLYDNDGNDDDDLEATPRVETGDSACEAKITYKCGEDDPAPLEARVSTSSSLSSGQWKKTSDLDFDCSGTSDTDKTVSIGKDDYDFQSGTTYYFAIKRKSPSSLTLDSNYILIHGSFTPSGC